LYFSSIATNKNLQAIRQTPKSVVNTAAPSISGSRAQICAINAQHAGLAARFAHLSPLGMTAKRMTCIRAHCFSKIDTDAKTPDATIALVCRGSFMSCILPHNLDQRTFSPTVYSHCQHAKTLSMMTGGGSQYQIVHRICDVIRPNEDYCHFRRQWARSLPILQSPKQVPCGVTCQ
jgi:hypothetical protein